MRRTFEDHEHFCYHVPVPRLVEKAHKRLAKINCYKDLTEEKMDYQIGSSLIYSREVGNCYTAALYLAIISLLDNTVKNLSDKLIGLYSYGSGCSGEYFSARVVPGYQKMSNRIIHEELMTTRTELSYDEYLAFYNFKLPIDGSNFILPEYNTGKVKLVAIEQHKRIYELI